LRGPDNKFFFLRVKEHERGDFGIHDFSRDIHHQAQELFKIQAGGDQIGNFGERLYLFDINQVLFFLFRHFLNYELNNTSNEITDSLLNLIKSGEYLPSISTKSLEITNVKDIREEGVESENVYPKKVKESVDQIKNIDNFVDDIREMRISEFMLNQLYENAASKNYNELIIIIDKLNKNDPLEENDRKLLAKYPFILNDSPNMAQINLEKAKKRVDRIKQAFGK